MAQLAASNAQSAKLVQQIATLNDRITDLLAVVQRRNMTAAELTPAAYKRAIAPPPA